MSSSTSRVGLTTPLRAYASALQWRLLLLWLAGLLLPTAILTLPISGMLSRHMDNSVHSLALAQRLDVNAFADMLGVLRAISPVLGNASLLATIVALLLSPLLTGMAITAVRAGRAPGFGDLLRGGVSEYGRLFRLLLVGILPMIVAFVIATAAYGYLGERDLEAIVPADVKTLGWLALAATLFAFLIAHASVEAARAQFAADGQLRSAFRAWGRGLKQLLRRPFATLGQYLLVTAIGLAIAGALAVWRINIPHANSLGLAGAFALAQLIVLSTAWMRTARLYALTEVVRSR
ncbi:hypothetical protein [Arenimonas oryziterrae]|uniref:Glycerophosphoryl diester phosphodiesterase membrane domain-containing protein n=1 Tax=Arenimonas oryziterrae DSM 21050 = YC6267 TaxID=1121015 RepID=A0A091BKN3_9GAMM|nr:hypothetical protein [Arenimonas oryziterrae]KFN44865.1 hypothetical protein N789_02280 [Arenimonas oryziterrae DSM 21050 = YC6267]